VFVDRIDKLVQKGNAEAKIKDFVITDENGNEQTDGILMTPGYTFLLFIKDPVTARTDNMDKLRELIDYCNANNIAFYVVCSADPETSAKYNKEWKLNAPFLVLDVTTSKTALRTNPGLLLLEQGVIRGKWSFRDYPTKEMLQSGKLKTK
jgi:hypothetical protein